MRDHETIACAPCLPLSAMWTRHKTWSPRRSPGPGRHGGRVSRHPAPRAWVVRTALNLSVSSWRRHRRELPLTDHDAPACGPASSLADTELTAVLQRLPARQRQVVALRIFLDLDTAHTAEVLGIAPGTVTAHLTRALTALRTEFATHGSEGDPS
jgi:DNA-directed RNA polymerase specialized sigma24 family protein